ncbi:hypothetical protein K470DRAFT_35295 [Piedraia hortae CBS 480.64]|uniref:CCHC-type domain-containing protein n=1 Tax=Piedraia hortae CBS 480.64 TaxID=1314780 RepID=A0A6A7C2T9_9PEZI|nr:hypothetical protein K470DRAFT_35295 [Piedraia hortae CBS 480.64]
MDPISLTGHIIPRAKQAISALGRCFRCDCPGHFATQCIRHPSHSAYHHRYFRRVEQQNGHKPSVLPRRWDYRGPTGQTCHAHTHFHYQPFFSS